jgi:hypothetical protein
MKKKSTHSEHLTRTRRQHWSKQTNVCNNCWILKLQNCKTVLIVAISLGFPGFPKKNELLLSPAPQCKCGLKFVHRHTKRAVVCHSYVMPSVLHLLCCVNIVLQCHVEWSWNTAPFANYIPPIIIWLQVQPFRSDLWYLVNISNIGCQSIAIILLTNYV